MDKKFKIYFLCDPESLEIRYIGQTSRTLKLRLNEHINYEYRSNYKSAWVKSLKKRKLVPIIKLVCSFDTRDESDLKEIELIKEYREKGYRLTNNTDGGNSPKGAKRSLETRLKLSLAKKGKPVWSKGVKFTDEHRANISKVRIGKKILNPRRGFTLPEETKKKIGASVSGEKNGFYGKKHTPETMAKLIEHRLKPENIQKSINTLKKITPEQIKKGADNRRGWKQTEEAKRQIRETLMKTLEAKKQQKLNEQKP